LTLFPQTTIDRVANLRGQMQIGEGVICYILSFVRWAC
jgi:hypothetical protein